MFDWKRYPLMQAFMTGAARANSAPPQFVRTEPPAQHLIAALPEAEQQLKEYINELLGGWGVNDTKVAFGLGCTADSGYTTLLDNKPMLAYTILEEEY